MYANHNKSLIIYSILQRLNFTLFFQSVIKYNIFNLCLLYNFSGYLDNATLINIQVLSIVRYYALF